MSVFLDMIEEVPISCADILPDAHDFGYKHCGAWVSKYNPYRKHWFQMRYACGDKYACEYCRQCLTEELRGRFNVAYGDSENKLFYATYSENDWQNIVKYVNDKNLYFCIPQLGNIVFVLFHHVANRGTQITEEEIERINFEKMLMHIPPNKRKSGNLGKVKKEKSGITARVPVVAIFDMEESNFNDKSKIINPESDSRIRQAQIESTKLIEDIVVETVEDIEKVCWTVANAYIANLHILGYKAKLLYHNMNLTPDMIQEMNYMALNSLARKAAKSEIPIFTS